MREYELTFILKPTIGEDAIASATERVESWIVANGGELVNVVPVGRKRLAYPISHQRDGSYVVMQFRAKPASLTEIERNLKLSEDVLRYILVRR